MAPVAVNENYLKTLQVFGDVDTLVGEAVEDYLTRRIIERIKAAREKFDGFERKYGMAYIAFSQKMDTDESFHNEINDSNPLWEQDALAWEYWHEEIEEWSEKLNAILIKS